LILEVARDRDECSGLGGWARRESVKTLDRGAGEVILRSSYTTEREGHASGDSSTAGLIYFTLKLILFDWLWEPACRQFHVRSVGVIRKYRVQAGSYKNRDRLLLNANWNYTHTVRAESGL